jgi:hypothetical protein
VLNFGLNEIWEWKEIEEIEEEDNGAKIYAYNKDTPLDFNCC